MQPKQETTTKIPLHGCFMGSYTSSFPSTITSFLFYTLLPSLTLSDPVFIHSISPNFTTSSLQSLDNGGAFLASLNNSFEARIMNSKPDLRFFYFVIIHVSSSTILWSANRDYPISQSSQLRFTTDGLTLYNDTGHPIWSTPPKLPPVASLQLLESGNLVLLDVTNNTVWESFDFPTNTLVMGQKLHAGKSLVSSTSDEDLSEGRYRLVIGDSDAMLQWNGITYWKLSMESNAFRDTNFPVEYLVMNFTGVYLMGDNGKEIVIQVVLHDSSDISANSSNFQFVKLDPNGLFSVVNIDGSSEPEFRVPADSCRIPAICSTLGVCVTGGTCECSPEFHHDFDKENRGCVPSDTSLALPGPCNGVSSSGRETKYLNLSSNLDYFSNDLVDPAMHDVNLSVCQNLCSRNCSCLGIFHSQNSGSCYVIRDYLGSMLNKSNYNWGTDRLGYIKTIRVEKPNANSRNKKLGFPILAVVLPLSSGTMVIAVVATLVWLRRRRRWGRRAKNLKLGQGNSSSAEREVFDWIPDLPARFNYEELAIATEGFRTKIGSGGFGTVYKGIRGATTDVIAVKKIDCLGAEGKREFLTEIATIGKIHHINLVKLKGFCVHRGQRFLIYEYMNRGSLDRTLFHGEPVLEWKERYKIALGTAKGLAYLHTGCEHKIIHCDVKPENILLNDKLQVKISDFGLSKLLSREQSGFFTTMRGTRGYVAPEWLTNTAISDKTDVYSYGMVLLEIISGMRNFFLQAQINSSGNSSSSSEEYGHRLQVNFPLRALEMHVERRYLELVDPRLMGKAPSEEVEKLVRVALCCVHRDPNLRPSMSNVVRMLEGGMALCEPRMQSLNFLRFYSPGALAENNEQNEIALHREEMSSTNDLHNAFSYISSHQVSGPR